MSRPNCIALVNMTGDGYRATVRDGRYRHTASCTSSPREAAQRAAAKWMRLDASNSVKPADLVAEQCDPALHNLKRGQTMWLVSYPSRRLQKDPA